MDRQTDFYNYRVDSPQKKTKFFQFKITIVLPELSALPPPINQMRENFFVVVDFLVNWWNHVFI